MPEIVLNSGLNSTWQRLCNTAAFTSVVMCHFAHENRVAYAFGTMAIDALEAAGAFRPQPEELPLKPAYLIVRNAVDHLALEWRAATEAGDAERARACRDAICTIEKITNLFKV